MRIIFLFFIIFTFSSAFSSFNLIKLNDKDNKNTILIVGGIHGNEPGSYFAPSFFLKHYTITSGSVWVIPVLNHKSIIRNARGIYGDMNRKFNFISKKDRDYNIVSNLKDVILDDKIDLVLNLHDGHGFYRTKYENHLLNPRAWGQASIIDQEHLHTSLKFSNLDDIAKRVSKEVNKDIKNKKYTFGVKNTKTKNKNKNMQKSLTYFAIKNHKPAFAIETSKNIHKLEIKVQYQLKAIEAYMKIADISFERDIDIDNLAEIKNSIYDFGYLKINDNFLLPLNNIRSYLPFIPIKRENNSFKFDNPLGMVKKKKNLYYVFIGNKHINTFKADYFNNDTNNKKMQISIEIDGQMKNIDIPSVIKVKDYFIVHNKTYRVNVIGFGNRKDNNKKITKSKIQKKYSIDKGNKFNRIEIYDNKLFLGSILVSFVL